jgi:hypothetical protein
MLPKKGGLLAESKFNGQQTDRVHLALEMSGGITGKRQQGQEHAQETIGSGADFQ